MLSARLPPTQLSATRVPMKTFGSKVAERMQEPEPSPVSSDRQVTTKRPSSNAVTAGEYWEPVPVVLTRKSLPAGLPSMLYRRPRIQLPEPSDGSSEYHVTTKRPSASAVMDGSY